MHRDCVACCRLSMIVALDLALLDARLDADARLAGVEVPKAPKAPSAHAGSAFLPAATFIFRPCYVLSVYQGCNPCHHEQLAVCSA